MKKIIILSTCIALILFSACRPEPLSINIEPIEPQIVVFSQIIPDALMTVALTKTIGALEFNEEEGDSLSQDIVNNLLVTKALVTVSYRDQTDTLFELATGVYSSLGTPSFVNEEYRLRVETMEGDTLSATSLMLPLIAFEEIKPIIKRTDKDTIVSVKFSLMDEPGKNWYMLNFYTNGVGDNNSGIELNSFLNQGSNVLKQTELISDIVFDGGRFDATIDLQDVNPTDSLVVTLSNISEEYYRFLEIRQNSSNFFTELTKEPVTLPTNVQGGLGFFNTHFPDIEFYDLNEF